MRRPMGGRGFSNTGGRADEIGSMVASLMSPSQRGPGGDHQTQNAGGVGMMLKQLLALSSMQPGMSWSVGMCAYSMDENDAYKLGDVAETMRARSTKPAMMTLSLRSPPHEVSAKATPPTPNASGDVDVEMEVCLWVCDLLSCVIELDSSGRVVEQTHDGGLEGPRAVTAMFPPGLLFGAQPRAMLGQHISAFLPLGAHPISDLFMAGALGPAPQDPMWGGPAAGPPGPMASGHPAAKKNLKGANKSALRVGPVQVLRLPQHPGDGRPLQFTVQAVQKGHGGHAGAFLLLRPYKPRTGSPNLSKWLSARHRLSASGLAHMSWAGLRRMSNLMPVSGSVAPPMMLPASLPGAAGGVPVMAESREDLALGAMVVEEPVLLQPAGFRGHGGLASPVKPSAAILDIDSAAAHRLDPPSVRPGSSGLLAPGSSGVMLREGSSMPSRLGQLAQLQQPGITAMSAQTAQLVRGSPAGFREGEEVDDLEAEEAADPDNDADAGSMRGADGDGVDDSAGAAEQQARDLLVQEITGGAELPATKSPSRGGVAVPPVAADDSFRAGSGSLSRPGAGSRAVLEVAGVQDSAQLHEGGMGEPGVQFGRTRPPSGPHAPRSSLDGVKLKTKVKDAKKERAIQGWVLSSGAKYHNDQQNDSAHASDEVAAKWDPVNAFKGKDDAKSSAPTNAPALLVEDLEEEGNQFMMMPPEDGENGGSGGGDDSSSPPPSSSDGGGGSDGEGSEDGEARARRRKAKAKEKRASKKSSSNNDDRSSMGEGEMDAAALLDEDSGMFKRGMRFKKLLRMLGSVQVQRPTRRFKVYALSVTLFVLAMHTGIFVLMYMLLNKQNVAVSDLNNMGLAARWASEVAIRTRDLSIFYNNMTQPNLRFMSSLDNFTIHMQKFENAINTFLYLHRGTYIGFDSPRRLPDIGNLRAMWELLTFNETSYLNVPCDELRNNFTTCSRVTQYRSRSLFEVGNVMGQWATNLLKNSPALYFKKKPVENIDLNPNLLYIIANMPNVVLPGYLASLDIMAEQVVEEAKNLNTIQLIILGAEGCGVCVLVVAYIWFLAAQVSNHRFNLCSVFIMVPQGLIRSLATRKLNLAEDGEDDDDDVPTLGTNIGGGEGNNDNNQGANGAGGQQGGKAVSFFGPSGGAGAKGRGGAMGQQSAKFGSSSLDGHGERGQHGEATSAWASVTRVFTFWRQGSSRISPSGPTGEKKRRLTKSAKASVWLTWPFVLWGLMVVLTNAIGYLLLAKIDEPIATFNIVNFVMVMYQRNFFFVQELAYSADAVAQKKLQDQTKTYLDGLRQEYNVMMLGKTAATGPNISSHYESLNDGVSFSSKATPILFEAQECMAEDPDDCLPDDHPLAVFQNNGLNRLMRRSLELAQTITQYRGADPSLNGDLFNFYWNTRPSTSGGLARLNGVYHDSVRQVYESVRYLHIICLVVTWLIMLCYAVFMVRPFMNETANETRRVAELLSQLPPELDVEAMLIKSLRLVPQIQAGGSGGLSAQALARAGSNGSRGEGSEGHSQLVKIKSVKAG